MTAVLLLTFLFVASCTTTPRLDIRFDADTAGSPPQPFPAPTPPADAIATTSLQAIASTVAARPGGGLWLRSTPTAQFVADPDVRRRILNMLTENFAVSPPASIRGGMDLRLDGQGTVSFGFASQQGANSTDYLVGFELSVFAPATAVPGELYLLKDFNNVNVDQVFPLPTMGQRIATYSPGQVIHISWSIDQLSRTFSVSANGGSPQHFVMPATSRGIASTPIQQLALVAWLWKVGSNTAVFMDNVLVEEIH